MSLFVVNDVKSGWKRIYPTIDGKILTIPVEDTMTSILRFVNSRIHKSAKPPIKGEIEVVDISIQGESKNRVATLVTKVSSNKRMKKYLTTLTLEYNVKKF